MYPKDSRDAKIQPISGLLFPNKTALEQHTYNERLAMNLGRLHAILRISKIFLIPERITGTVPQCAAIDLPIAILARAMPARPWPEKLGSGDGGRGLGGIRALNAGGRYCSDNIVVC